MPTALRGHVNRTQRGSHNLHSGPTGRQSIARGVNPWSRIPSSSKALRRDRTRANQSYPAIFHQGLTTNNYLYIHVAYRRAFRTMSDKSKKLADEALSCCIATRLRLATRVITKVYDDALRPFGLTASQMALLAVAAGREILRQADVSTQLQMDNSTLSRNLDRMRANG